jgi:hypothetical protein
VALKRVDRQTFCKPVEEPQEPAAPLADRAVRQAALDKMRKFVRGGIGGGRKSKEEIWQPILDKHARGEPVSPYALKLAREAMGHGEDDAARLAVDEELRNKAVVPGGADGS